MMNLFYMGGTFFMSILSLIFLAMIVLAVLNAIQLLNGKPISEGQLSMVKSVGLFAMVTGIFGQMIGLVAAFEAIEQAGSVTQAMLVSGLKVSSIATMYGMTIYLLSYMIWFGETAWRNHLKG